MADPTTRTTLLEFPCDFPIKIMGVRTDDFTQAIVDVVQHHAPDFEAGTLQTRASRNGNYLSLTCTLRAHSQQQLDALYRELSAHPLVKVVL